MYAAFTFLMLFSAIVLQTTVLHFLPIGGVQPDLVLVIVVYLGLVRGPEIGCVTGFAFGLIEDFFSPGLYIGSNALSKTLVGFFCGAGGKQLYTHSIFSQMLSVVVSTGLDVILHCSIKGFRPEWKMMLLYQIAYNLLCCPFIVLIFRKGEKLWGDKSPSSNF